VPPDGELALIAAAAALLPAWLMTRSLDSNRPGWAVRGYLGLFSMSELKRVRDASARRARYPVREAFLATWFLLFFIIFGIGLFLWPEAAGR
jgi:hypothetical protein